MLRKKRISARQYQRGNDYYLFHLNKIERNKNYAKQIAMQSLMQ